MNAAFAPETLGPLLDTYAGFGSKRSGGSGDNACGAWVQQQMEQRGFVTARQGFSVPGLSVSQAWLELNDEMRLPVWVHATAPVEDEPAPLCLEETVASGAIAVIRLAHHRWSYLGERGTRERITRAFARGARAVVLITEGPTGEVIALNHSATDHGFAGPVVIIAPTAAAAVLNGASRAAPARLHINAHRLKRQAFNVIGRREGGTRGDIVLSTPRSGWFNCAAERGSGIAALLALGQWAGDSGFDVSLVCTSGHETGHQGAEAFLQEGAPDPATTRLWVHLGSNLASRDYHEAGETWVPLPSSDPQRFLVATPSLLPFARTAFAGLAGLEQPYSTEHGVMGELGDITARGYRAAGIMGAHRQHHTRLDDRSCVCEQQVARTIAALARLIDAAC